MSVLRHICRIGVIVIIVACAFAPSQSRAQSPELTAAYKEALKLNKQGKYAEAIPFAARVVELPKRVA